MSRIGKKPITIPEDVTVEIKDGVITTKGPKGDLSWRYPARIDVLVEGNDISVKKSTDTKTDNALYGLTRSIIANMVIGVSKGYQRILDIVGVGYKAQVAGNKLILALGYSHPIEFPLPEGIKAAVDAKQTQITLTGIDKQVIGQVSAALKSLRPPDAYKGKGVRYSGEKLKLKAGKAGKK